MTKVFKVLKDSIVKNIWGNDGLSPKGLFELSEYMRHNKGINFEFHKNEDGSYVAVSTDFRHGSIITQGKDLIDLDRNIRDAILTSFEIPYSYAKEAKLVKVGEELKGYALA